MRAIESERLRLDRAQNQSAQNQSARASVARARAPLSRLIGSRSCVRSPLGDASLSCPRPSSLDTHPQSFGLEKVMLAGDVFRWLR